MSTNTIVREVITEVITPETILTWSRENVLGVRNKNWEPGAGFTLMPFNVTMGDRIPEELMPENYIVQGGDILIRKNSVPGGTKVLDLIQKVRITHLSLELVLSRSYNISPWDLNSVLLVPYSDLNKDVYLIEK